MNQQAIVDISFLDDICERYRSACSNFLCYMSIYTLFEICYPSQALYRQSDILERVVGVLEELAISDAEINRLAGNNWGTEEEWEHVEMMIEEIYYHAQEKIETPFINNSDWYVISTHPETKLACVALCETR